MSVPPVPRSAPLRSGVAHEIEAAAKKIHQLFEASAIPQLPISPEIRFGTRVEVISLRPPLADCILAQAPERGGWTISRSPSFPCRGERYTQT